MASTSIDCSVKVGDARGHRRRGARRPRRGRSRSARPRHRHAVEPVDEVLGEGQRGRRHRGQARLRRRRGRRAPSSRARSPASSRSTTRARRRACIIRALNQLHRLMRGKKSVALQAGHRQGHRRQDVPGLRPHRQVRRHAAVDQVRARLPAQPDRPRVPAHARRAPRLRGLRQRQEALLPQARRRRLGHQARASALPGDSALEKFMPRLSTAHQVSEVQGLRLGSRSTRRRSSAVAKPQSSKLGDKHGSAGRRRQAQGRAAGQVESPVSSKEEADNIAKSILNDRMMDFITGDGVCRGNPDIKPGIIVTVNVQDKRFDGKYYVTAVRHRYVHAGTAGGYRTEFKFRRDAKSDSWSRPASHGAPETGRKSQRLGRVRGLTPKRTADYTFRALKSGASGGAHGGRRSGDDLAGRARRSRRRTRAQSSLPVL